MREQDRQCEGGAAVRRVSLLTEEIGIGREEALALLGQDPRGYLAEGRRAKVHIMAIGDVGLQLLLGLKLLGGDCIEEIGIYDLSEKQLAWVEIEAGQISYPFPEEGGQRLPEVKIVSEEALCDCDALVFCASRSVPAIGAAGDVRMMQLDANREIIRGLAEKLDRAAYQGLVCVVSDPVDPLCGALLAASNLAPHQIRGFGLGVMNARARYYAKKDPRFAVYLTEGRAFGPHGQDLVIANSIERYDDALSRALTELAVTANMKVRDLGYKPFLAPALSSGALSILLTLRGEWNYGSVYLGDGGRGAFLGVRSRLGAEGVEFEDPALPEALYERIKAAYLSLVRLGEGGGKA